MRFLGLALIALSGVASASDIELAHSVRLLDADGAPISGVQDLRVALYTHPTATTGALAWEDTFEDASIEAGYAALILGSGAPLPSSVLNASALWVETQVGTDPPLAPRTVLYRAPHAEVAHRVRASATPTGGCSDEGALLFDRDADQLLVCDGVEWIPVGGRRSLVTVDGARQWSDGTHGASCRDYFEDPDYPGALDGLYRIDPDGAGAEAARLAWCDMSTSPGGWTLIFHAYHLDPVTKANQFTVVADAAITDPLAKGGHVNLLPLDGYALVRTAEELRFVYHDLSGNLTGAAAHQEVEAEGSFANLFAAPSETNHVAVTARERTGSARVITSGPRVYWGACSAYGTALRFDTYRDASYYSSPACHMNTYGNPGHTAANLDFASYADGNGKGMGTVGNEGWGVSAHDHVYNIYAR